VGGLSLALGGLVVHRSGMVVLLAGSSRRWEEGIPAPISSLKRPRISARMTQFIELARSVYRLKDRRAGLKRALNEVLRSRFLEQKWHAGTVP
jgi:hypothetical protein